MKKILLICSAGTSTSVVVKKMVDEAKKQGKEFEILSASNTEAKSIWQDWDVLLISPQLKHQLKAFQTLAKDKIVKDIPPMAYGRMDAKAILKLVE